MLFSFSPRVLFLVFLNKEAMISLFSYCFFEIDIASKLIDQINLLRCVFFFLGGLLANLVFIVDIFVNFEKIYCQTEVESLRTFLASRTPSRTHFYVLVLGLEDQVLGLGLQASSSRKLPSPRLESSIIFLSC